MSVAPIAVTGRAERSSLPRWVFGAMAAAVLAPAAFWFGETMSNLRAARRAQAAENESSVESRTAALDVSPTFALSTRVSPDSAVIWLDRHPVATGRLRMMLPKDGSTHELRVAAPGHVPVTVFFADVPPPQEIALDALPAGHQPLEESPLAAGVAAGLTSAATTSVAAVAPAGTGGGARSAAQRHASRDSSALTSSSQPPLARAPDALDERGGALPSRPLDRRKPRPEARALETRPPAQPHVQLIDDGSPQVRVIE
jgi:hypothetical protein